MEKAYAAALQEALEKGIDEQKLVAWLVTHLKAEGRSKLLPGILAELKALNAREAKSAARLEVASEGEKAEALKEAKQAGIESPLVTINPDIIRGWRAQEGGMLIDRSGKKALVELYRNIVTH
ncbi:MAG TPA: hypothetical protein VHO23_00655 [Candidatus Paceibacterota bacterium]|nr:hypothetical protein [Candidatus Paceibacterota bacterium]